MNGNGAELSIRIQIAIDELLMQMVCQLRSSQTEYPACEGECYNYLSRLSVVERWLGQNVLCQLWVVTLKVWVVISPFVCA